MKKLVGALRALWRSSKIGGADDNIAKLKTYLRASPSPARENAPAQPLADQADSSDHDGGEVPEGGADGEGSDDGYLSNDESDSAIQDDVSDRGAPSVNDENEEGEDVSENDDGEPASDLDEPACSHDQDSREPASQDSLTAPTLMLGEEPSQEEVSSDDEDLWHDSQLEKSGAGWLGKAYNTYNAMDKEEKKQVEMAKLLDDIRGDLETEIGTSLEGAKVWTDYAVWCRHALESYGNQVYSMLAGQLREFPIFHQSQDWGGVHVGKGLDSMI